MSKVSLSIPVELKQQIQQINYSLTAIAHNMVHVLLDLHEKEKAGAQTVIEILNEQNETHHNYEFNFDPPQYPRGTKSTHQQINRKLKFDQNLKVLTEQYGYKNNTAVILAALHLGVRLYKEIFLIDNAELINIMPDGKRQKYLILMFS